jgi:hypothetical protein
MADWGQGLQLTASPVTGAAAHHVGGQDQGTYVNTGARRRAPVRSKAAPVDGSGCTSGSGDTAGHAATGPPGNGLASSSVSGWRQWFCRRRVTRTTLGRSLRAGSRQRSWWRKGLHTIPTQTGAPRPMTRSVTHRPALEIGPFVLTPLVRGGGRCLRRGGLGPILRRG